MSNNKLLFAIVIVLLATNVWAFRISRPPTFTLPWTPDQIAQLNDALEDLWNLQNGEFNFDIVTSTKTNANNGDLWLIDTATVVRLQYKTKYGIFNITPDGF